MSEAVGVSAAGAGANPFSGRTALMLVLFGSLVFVALLWMIGNGLGTGDANDGGGHAEGRGLNGFSAFAKLLEQGGRTVRRSRSAAAFDEPGLLILTPPAQARGSDIATAVERHRLYGPTLVITPKWITVPTSLQDSSAKRGWVRLAGASGPNWPGFLDQVSVDIKPGSPSTSWRTRTLSGSFPDARQVMSGAVSGSEPGARANAGASSGPGLVPLVTGAGGAIHAAYLDDGYFAALEAISPDGQTSGYGYGEYDEEEGAAYPLVIVFDPDLLDNYGMAKLPSAQLADALVGATSGADGPVIFDLTLNGLERQASLLTLAFTPPFLAATLCLLLAAGAVGWRAFLRFGPPQVPGRAIAFGKRALVTNAAGLIVRSRRYHLLGVPYADAARQRLARAFALPRASDARAELAALDAAAVAAGAEPHAFSQAAARLGQARTERDLVKAAADLHALEKTLTR
jgi:hypothetical protein